MALSALSTIITNLKQFHQITELSGSYTLDEVDALREYLQQVTIYRLFLYHSLLLFGIIGQIVLVNMTPLADIHDGWLSKNLNMIVLIFFGVILLNIGQYYQLERLYPFIKVSKPRKLLIYLLSSIATVIYLLLIEYFTDCFPLPFLISLVGICCLPCFALSILLILPKKQVQNLKRKHQFLYFCGLLGCILALEFLYNVFVLFYQDSETISVFLSGCSLVCMRYLVERIIYFCVVQCTKYRIEKGNLALIALLLAQVTNTLYTSVCIQVSISLKSVIGICCIEILEAMSYGRKLYQEIWILDYQIGEIPSDLRNEAYLSFIAKQIPKRFSRNQTMPLKTDIMPVATKWISSFVKPCARNINVNLSEGVITTSKDTVVKNARRPSNFATATFKIFTTSHKKLSQLLFTAIIPIDQINLSTLTASDRQLRILFVTEDIGLQLYIKVTLPLVNYLVNEIRAYTASEKLDRTLQELYLNTEIATRIRINNAMFIATEIILGIVIYKVYSKYVHYSIFHQLSRIVFSNRLLIISMFVVWVVICQTFTIPHYGNDYTFKNVCLKKKT